MVYFIYILFHAYSISYVSETLKVSVTNVVPSNDQRAGSLLHMNLECYLKKYYAAVLN